MSFNRINNNQEYTYDELPFGNRKPQLKEMFSTVAVKF